MKGHILTTQHQKQRRYMNIVSQMMLLTLTENCHLLSHRHQLAITWVTPS